MRRERASAVSASTHHSSVRVTSTVASSSALDGFSALIGKWRTRRTLWPGKVAFSNYALVLFAGTLDSIFELAPTVRKLFGHLVGSARHVTTYDGPEVYDLTDLEFR